MPNRTIRTPIILLVDDTLENLRLLANMLDGQGYDVRPVTSGRQALQAFEHATPDLVLLDVNMPDMDGYEVCQHLKSREGAKDVPVVFLTALTETTDKVRAFQVGAVDYITKPFQFDEVLARVRTHLALRRAHQELALNYTRLRDAEAMRDQLVHMVVHDMRAPLTALLANLDFLREDLGDTLATDSIDDLDASVAAARALNHMANQLLDVSRLEDDKFPLTRTHTDLVAVARTVVERLGAIDRNRVLEIDAPEHVFAVCDGELIRRVIENLVSNAVKHTPAGGRVRISIASSGGSGGARVVVRDEGDGIPAESRDRIFEKFAALQSGHGRHSAGLGLTFCKLAVEAHGGTIGVECGAERGSDFWFTLDASQ